MAKKAIVITILLFTSLLGFTQEENEKKDMYGYLLAQPTISPGFMTEGGFMNSYFHATLEYFPEKKFSLRTDGLYFLSTQGDVQPLAFSHKMFLGVFYHHTLKNSSYYFGFQPGAAYSKQNAYSYNDSLVTNPPLRVSGLIGISAGVNYYFWKIFNFFLAVHYNHGVYIPEYGEAMSLGEFRIAGGLGWNFRIRKPKN